MIKRITLPIMKRIKINFLISFSFLNFSMLFSALIFHIFLALDFEPYFLITNFTPSGLIYLYLGLTILLNITIIHYFNINNHLLIYYTYFILSSFTFYIVSDIIYLNLFLDLFHQLDLIAESDIIKLQ